MNLFDLHSLTQGVIFFFLILHKAQQYTFIQNILYFFMEGGGGNLNVYAFKPSHPKL